MTSSGGYQIPSGWRIATLGELCDGKGSYGANVTKAVFDPRLPRYVRITDITGDGRLRMDDMASISPEDAEPHMLQPGDVLLARSGATVGKSYVHDAQNGCCAHAGYLIRFRTRRDILLANYLKHFLHSSFYWKWVAETQRAQAQPNINASEYAALELPLPPIDEQRKIAAILSSVDDTIQTTQAVIDQLGVVKKALMAELLTRGIPGRHTKFKQTEIGEVPEAWEVVLLEEAATKISDGEHLSPNLHTKGRPLLSAKHVREDSLLFADFGLVTDADFAKFRKRCDPEVGDVLMVSRGATIGRVHYLNSIPEPFCLMGSVIQIRTKPDKVSGEFLAAYLELQQAQRELIRTSGASAQQAIYLAHLKKMPVPIPPFREQLHIANMRASISLRMRNEIAVVQKLESLKTDLMNILLTGDLRVPLAETPA